LTGDKTEREGEKKTKRRQRKEDGLSIFLSDVGTDIYLGTHID
jgi:hypothetical protein